MILTTEEIKEVILNQNSDYLKNVKYESKLNLFVNGAYFLKELSALEKLETDKQKELRERYAKSTKALSYSMIRPFSNIFTAVGGSSEYLFDGNEETQKKLKTELSIKIRSPKLSHGVEAFMNSIWMKRVIDSPRSLFLIEVSEDNQNAYPVFIPAYNIKNWKTKGNFEYEYICLQEGTFNDNSTQYEVFRVIDDFADYTVIVNNKDNQDVSIVEIGQSITLTDFQDNEKQFLSFKHFWDRVPAIQLTDKLDSDMQNKVSFLDPVIELLKDQMLDDSVKRTFKFLHGYPIYAEYDFITCSDCGGAGQTPVEGVCLTCAGTGHRKKSVTDAIRVDTPETKEDATVKPSDVAAYISPPIETWVQMNEDLKANKEEIQFTLWNTLIVSEQNKQNSTAFGRYLDVKPVNDILTEYSNIAQNVDTLITDFLGEFYFPDQFKESIKLYGNFFLTSTPDQLLDKYQELLKNKANSNDLDKILSDYYQTVYAKNNLKRAVSLQDLKFEPYRHNTVEEVQALQISDTIKARKAYYKLFRNTISDIEFLQIKDIETFSELLDNYILTFEPPNTIQNE